MRITEHCEFAQRFESCGKTTIKDVTISYKVISEDTFFDDSCGNTIASMFSFSYFGEEEVQSKERPVVFVFNGGPGSSSVWLHIGLFGPQRLKCTDPINDPVTPPFSVEDNPVGLLDICDLVFIDPVGTGYSKVLDEDGAKWFYNTKNDAQAFSLFIENWLTKYDRWNCPRFLVGESYGSIRAALLADDLMVTGNQLKAIPMNGVIFIGPALNYAPYYSPASMDPSVDRFTAFASTNWYHNNPASDTLEAFVEKAEAFACGDYLRALYMGNRLTEEEYREVVENASFFTGMSERYLVDNHLRIDLMDFKYKLLESKGLEIGLYDSRYTLPCNTQLGNVHPVADDAAMSHYTTMYVGAFNAVVKRNLGLSLSRPYVSINFDFEFSGIWDWTTPRDPGPALLAGMRRNTELCAFFGTGLYDLATVPGAVKYLTSRLALPKERVTIKEYASGHMPYIGEDSCEQLATDIKHFVVESLHKKKQP